jgi:hypothetical protein
MPEYDSEVEAWLLQRSLENAVIFFRDVLKELSKGNSKLYVELNTGCKLTLNRLGLVTNLKGGNGRQRTVTPLCLQLLKATKNIELGKNLG